MPTPATPAPKPGAAATPAPAISDKGVAPAEPAKLPNGELPTASNIDLSQVQIFTKDEAAPADEPAVEPAKGDGEGEEAAAAEGDGEEEAEGGEEEPAPRKSQEFVELQRLERKARQLQQERDELAKKLETNAPKPLTLETAWDAIAEAGIKPQDLVDQLLERAKNKNPPKPKTEAEKLNEKVAKEVEELRKWKQDREKAEAQAKADAAAKEAVATLQKDIDAAAEDFPFLAAYKDEATDSIWNAMLEHWNTKREVPDQRALMEKANEYYRSLFEKGQAALTKGGAAGTVVPASRSHQQTVSGRPTAGGPRSITNRAAASATPTTPSKPLSEEEAREAAKAALKFR